MVHPDKGRGNSSIYMRVPLKSAKVTSKLYYETMGEMKKWLNLNIHEMTPI